ncbi:DUF927 domain-containing protein [Actinomadura harenae]|uniref:DUF927 domain-containing protein n=1 Tax=Actinomadura harenae TaxID=2483351 RepID=A0A3M2M8U8_9ACTN|nr:DUF927 domain-containing protein [Actinomadura harenae]RMI45293.1 DUF927 domain-containing protein [Actinomadura harenae]
MSTRDHDGDDRPRDQNDDPSDPGSTDHQDPSAEAKVRRPTKHDRALTLLTEHLQLRRSEYGWPYARGGDRLFRFDRAGRNELYAEARHLWRKANEDTPPDERTLRQVVADLQRTAQDAAVDDAAATEWLGEHGVEAPPDESDHEGGLAALLELPGAPVDGDYVIPDPYTVAPDAIWRWRIDGPPERVAWGPVLATKVFTDPDGEELVELAWWHRHRWRIATVPRAIAKSGRMLVRELGNRGLPITEADAKSAERFLAAVETANTDTIQEVTIARALGWQADGTFVAASGHPYEVHGIEHQLQRALEAHREHGSLTGWQTAVKAAQRYPSVAAAIYAGLAAPLLEVLGISSFTLNLAGTSTGGKTTAAQGGLSCWADPDEAGGAITSWSATKTAHQARLALAGNGTPLLFDDTQTAGKPEIVSDMLYQVTQNQGKGRMGEWRSYRWRTILLSTGERSALSFATHQGISARVLDLAGSPFGHSERSGPDAQAFREGVTANYGLAGPAFVERLRSYLGTHGPDKLLARHAELTELHRQDATSIARRRAPLVAVIRLAAELAHYFEIVPFPSLPDTTWRTLFVADDPRDNRAQLALEVIKEYIASFSDRLYESGRTAPPGGWIGTRTEIGDDKNAIALLPQRVREALSNAGYELDAVLQGWREAKALHEHPPGSKQRPVYQIARRIGGSKPRCFAFRGELFSDDE